jgi:hypothetical protein
MIEKENRMSQSELDLATRARFRAIVLSFTLCLLSAALPLPSFGQGTIFRQADFLPKEIADIQMGASQAWLLERIKNSGTHSSAPLARPNRIKIKWVPSNNPNYSEIDFMFTEKDRLYLMSFALSDESRWNVNALKKQFLDKFRISTERPAKFRIGEKDMISYSPATGGKCNFFEVTEVRSGKKSLELFDKSIDRQDRPPAKPAKQGKAKGEGKAQSQ